MYLERDSALPLSCGSHTNVYKAQLSIFSTSMHCIRAKITFIIAVASSPLVIFTWVRLWLQHDHAAYWCICVFSSHLRIKVPMVSLTFVLCLLLVCFFDFGAVPAQQLLWSVWFIPALLLVTSQPPHSHHRVHDPYQFWHNLRTCLQIVSCLLVGHLLRVLSPLDRISNKLLAAD